MSTPPKSKLFTPVQIGPFSLSHRVVMAPLTRLRSEQLGDIPGDLMAKMYGQRASGRGLIIAEGRSSVAAISVRLASIRMHRSLGGRR
jgi:N-ethylmaleimide reductase